MPVFEFAGFRLDTAKRQLAGVYGPVVLSPKAVDVLCVLVARSGQTVEKDELLREVWGSTVVEENTLARNVLLIRRALGESAGDNLFISTVAGRGYRFVHTVVPVSGETAVAKSRRFGKLHVGLLTATVLAVVTAIGAIDWRMNKGDKTFAPGSVDYATRNGSVLKFAVSPDGRTLVYASGILEYQSLRIRDLATNQESELLKAGRLDFMGLTLTGTSLFFVARQASERTGSLYRIPLTGGQAERLFTEVESPVSFSPDGRIAFVREDRDSGESRLVLSQPDGTKARVLSSTKLPVYLDYPAWSPDGLYIAATQIDREDNHLVVFAGDSGKGQRLGGRWGFPMCPRWMPDGRQLILVAYGIGEAGRQLWSVSWPGGATKPVTRDLDEYVDLSVSNDGRTLFALNRKLTTSVWTAPAGDPGAARQIVFGTDTSSGLSWTRDRLLVYESKGKLWSTPGDGVSRKQLTWEGQSYHPSVCRDNGHLAHIYKVNEAMFFQLMDSNGQVLRRSSVRMATSPECSPDGRWIVFMDGRKPGYPLVRLDLENKREMILSPSTTAAAAISADGSRIAHLTERPDTLSVLPANGGSPLQSFSLPASTHAVPGVVRWTPDGNGIAYIDRSGAGNVWIQPLAAGPPRQYTNLDNERVLSFDWSVDGKDLAMIRASTAQDVVMIHDRREP